MARSQPARLTRMTTTHMIVGISVQKEWQLHFLVERGERT